jgi:hypothetical protein
MLDPFKHNAVKGGKDMNRLSIQERAKIIGCLVEGNSIRATARLTGTDKKTVLRLLASVGAACQDFHDKNVRNVKTARVQCDEIWSFCYAKEKNVPKEVKGTLGYGSVWTWTALCADTKLMISYTLGWREGADAMRLMDDLRSRLSHRIQLTTDGYRAYALAVDEAFGADVDYAILIKLYGETQSDGRYSPAECIGTKRKKITGNPALQHVSTSFAERQNLSPLLLCLSLRRERGCWRKPCVN